MIFAHTLSSSASASEIRTEASPGIVVHGRSTEGEAIISAEISDLEIRQSIADTEAKTTRNNFYASAKIKNSGQIFQGHKTKVKHKNQNLLVNSVALQKNPRGPYIQPSELPYHNPNEKNKLRH